MLLDTGLEHWSYDKESQSLRAILNSENKSEYKSEILRRAW